MPWTNMGPMGYILRGPPIGVMGQSFLLLPMPCLKVLLEQILVLFGTDVGSLIDWDSWLISESLLQSSLNVF